MTQIKDKWKKTKSTQEKNKERKPKASEKELQEQSIKSKNNKKNDENSAINNKVFRVENLNFYYNYGKKQALFNINIAFERNKVTALIGPSGCGKSTLLRTLNRMNDLTEGSKVKGKIWFNDWDIYENKKNVISLRTKVGMVFQRPNPFPMSIFDNIAYGPRNQGIKNKKILNQIVTESLKQAALWDEVKSHLFDSALSLSGGQQQRLCIARALALKPEVLLMDEPTSALDPIASAKIEELIMQLRKDYTIILVTHSMQQAAKVSYQTAFFLKGHLIEFDKTKKLFSRPKQKQTEDYITGRFT
nr:phosphate ABC transporter ATP-binding protein PstB [Spiroplasma sp. JKS002669]